MASEDKLAPGEGDPVGTTGRKPGKTARKTSAAFDVWLNRSLHKLYDDVAREPVPDELLRIIRDDQAG